MRRRREGAQRGDRRLGAAREGHAHRRQPPSRSARSASRRCSGAVRSRIRTPSRWSSSCWMTRAAKPSGSISNVSPSHVLRAHPDRHGPRHLDADLADREAALVVELLLLGPPGDLGVAEHDRRGVLAGQHDGQAPQRAHLGSGEADAARVVHDRDHALGLVLQHLVERGDRERGGAQHGVADLADLGQGGEPPALENGVVEGARGHAPTLAAPRRGPGTPAVRRPAPSRRRGRARAGPRSARGRRSAPGSPARAVPDASLSTAIAHRGAWPVRSITSGGTGEHPDHAAADDQRARRRSRRRAGWPAREPAPTSRRGGR